MKNNTIDVDNLQIDTLGRMVDKAVEMNTKSVSLQKQMTQQPSRQST